MAIGIIPILLVWGYSSEVTEMNEDIENQTETEESIDTERRKALSKLGLVASAAYASPVLMTLSKSAHATDDDEQPSESEPSESEPSESEPSESEPSESEPSESEPSESEPSESEPSESEPSDGSEDEGSL